MEVDLHIQTHIETYTDIVENVNSPSSTYFPKDSRQEIKLKLLIPLPFYQESLRVTKMSKSWITGMSFPVFHIEGLVLSLATKTGQTVLFMKAGCSTHAVQCPLAYRTKQAFATGLSLKLTNLSVSTAEQGHSWENLFVVICVSWEFLAVKNVVIPERFG